MPATTYEEAKICPKCGKPGDVVKIQPAPTDLGLKPGTMLHFIGCRTELCKWFLDLSGPWMVQVNPDGSIPAAKDHTKEAKIYRGFEDHDRRAAQIVEYLKIQADLELEKGTEIKSPGR